MRFITVKSIKVVFGNSVDASIVRPLRIKPLCVSSTYLIHLSSIVRGSVENRLRDI